jgi:hypothetical protein
MSMLPWLGLVEQLSTGSIKRRRTRRDNKRAALEGMAKKNEEFLAGGGKLYVDAAE